MSFKDFITLPRSVLSMRVTYHRDVDMMLIFTASHTHPRGFFGKREQTVRRQGRVRSCVGLALLFLYEFAAVLDPRGGKDEEKDK